MPPVRNQTESRANGRGEPLLSCVIPLLLGLLIVQANDAPPAERTGPAFQVFADIDHKGKLSGPLKVSPEAGKDFVVVAALPTRGADRERLL